MIRRGFYPTQYKRSVKGIKNNQNSILRSSRKQLSSITNTPTSRKSQHNQRSVKSVKENESYQQSLKANIRSLKEKHLSTSTKIQYKKKQKKNNFLLVSNRKQITQCQKRSSIYNMFRQKQKQKVKKTIIDCKQNTFYRKFHMKTPFKPINNTIRGLKCENDTNVIGWDFQTQDDVFFE